jgi:hypothetical protein
MRRRENYLPGEPKIEAFLTYLAVEGNVAAATQNQAIIVGPNIESPRGVI